MKFMNWGKSLMLSMVVFIVFIATLVTIMIKTSVDLEDEQYYNRELLYEKELAALRKGEEVKKFQILYGEDSLHIVLPSWIKSRKGRIQFFRPNDQELDFHYDFENQEELMIPKSSFVTGKYEVSMITGAKGEEIIQQLDFYFKQP